MKTLKRFLAGLLAAAALCSTAFAWTSTPVNMDEVEVDVGASTWAVEELAAADQAGLIPQLTGNPGYQDAITREQFAELVVQAVTVICGEPGTAPADTFIDTTNPAILKAYQAGIVDGVGNSKFAPTQTTNREQIATMIARAIAYIKAETGVDPAPLPGISASTRTRHRSPAGLWTVSACWHPTAS